MSFLILNYFLRGYIISLSSCSDIVSIVKGVDALNKINQSSTDKTNITNTPDNKATTEKNTDQTKVVEIQILNPANKSSVEWYKKDDKNIVMKIGSQANLIGTVILNDGTKSSNVAWSSSDNTIAVVNNGKISANKLGITTVLATSTLDSTYKGLVNIEVVDDANFATSDRTSPYFSQAKKIS